MENADSTANLSKPRETLSVFDAVTIIVGVVVGAGIFKTPAIVAASATGKWTLLLIWLAGGAISLAGALCYAELSSAYPHAGGDYTYLYRAFGRVPAFLLAWARLTVIQTGSIAMIAFLVGDYASELIRLGRFSSSYYAGLAILVLTGINAAGIEQGRSAQRILMGAIILGLLFVTVVGLTTDAPAPAFPQPPAGGRQALGKAMIFVLLTYGGWNEAAYLSGEVRQARRNMARVLLYSIGLITAIYVLINMALVKGMGLAAMTGSEAVAADLMRRDLGENGARFISILVFLVALSTMNGMIITGARTSYAMGRDFSFFRFLGKWGRRRNTPVNAMLFQGAIALALVLMGTLGRSGFVMMVEYTAPVFWLFLLLAALSIFILRFKDPGATRFFPVPFYPLTPFLFSAACIYMLHASLVHSGKGALVGVGVLLAGLCLSILPDRHQKRDEKHFRKVNP
ncbi:MAG: APC family permease [Desulfobacteraceae bacterium]|nr:MAG: APC family permease [Desulfobacteraceae bacterium]